MLQQKAQISGWGNYPMASCTVARPERMRQLQTDCNSFIVRGSGKSYGDAALNSNGSVLLMERLNRFLEFNPKTGVLRAEAGCTLAEVLEVCVPKGWFLPVTPGTKYVTLGGCLAADVHGKNHHRDGAFSAHVHECVLQLASGVEKSCSKTLESALFYATAGGMGLTGIITEMTLQLIPITSSSMQVTHHKAVNLDALLALLDDPAIDDAYSVAWIDCLAIGPQLGRGIVMNGHHLPSSNGRLSVPKGTRGSIPFWFPSGLLNPWSVKAFNSFYYMAQGTKTTPFITDYDSYFYPLDAISNWNRIYGKKGFLQYQFVLPTESGLRALLQRFADQRCASFLAVLKKFGPHNGGYLSFPMAGYTLAIDIPIGDASLFSFLDTLDRQVIEFGGRVYLAKDARLSREAFRAMYPRFDEWRQIKAQVDPKTRFQSNLYRRLMMEERG